MASKKFTQHAFDTEGREMTTGRNLEQLGIERVLVVLNYPNNTKVTISGTTEVVTQILHRLDKQVIECKL